MKSRLLLLALTPFTFSLAKPVDLLVKFSGPQTEVSINQFVKQNGGSVSLVSREGNLYKWHSEQDKNLTLNNGVEYVQKSFTYGLLQNPSIARHQSALRAMLANGGHLPKDDVRAEDNPEIPTPVSESTGSDPLLKNAWGIAKIGADKNWKESASGKGIVAAVIDTGVDYTHEDLVNNIWRGPGGKIGYDFVDNDDKPYDLAGNLFEILLTGANPGHGTHVSGVIGARLKNGKGTAGVAPQVKIMPIRFISKEGKGTTEAAIKAIDFAVENGAKVINASWGGEKGEEGDDSDKALEDTIKRAGEKGVIFICAAGNGRAAAGATEALGFDLDTDSKPVYPAAWNLPNMITVAATDSDDKLAKFSNWGKKTVDLGAPGVKILSTTPGNKYQDTILDMGGMKVTWDGTSMATPFVVGAMSALWSEHPSDTAEQAIHRLLDHVTSVSSLDDKVVTAGRLQLQ